MPRGPLYKTSVAPYHVVSRTTGRFFFDVPMPFVWRLFLDYISRTELKYGIQTYHFLLMSNHIHWILKTPGENIDLAMQFCLSRVAKEIQSLAGLTGHLWGGRYKYSVIESDDQHFNVVKYTYRNPPKAGITRLVEQYRFSTLNVYLGKAQVPFTLQDAWFSERAANDTSGVLEWLNSPFPNELDKHIQSGLRRRSFRLPKKVSECKEK